MFFFLFQALGFEEGYDVDIERLSKLYKDLQRRLHPDKYAQKSKVWLPLDLSGKLVEFCEDVVVS